MAAALTSSSSVALLPRIGNAATGNYKSNYKKSASSVCFAWRRTTPVDIDIGLDEKPFVYRRASAVERWPNSNDELQQRAAREELQSNGAEVGVRVSEEGPSGHTSSINRRTSAAERWTNSNDEFQQRAARDESQSNDAEVGVRVRVRVEEEEEQSGHPSPIYRHESADERWLSSSDEFQQRAAREKSQSKDAKDRVRVRARVSEEEQSGHTSGHNSPIYRLMREDKAREKARERVIFHQRQTVRVKRMNWMTKLALKRAKDWKSRTERLATAICDLELARPVEDVLESWPEQLNNEDMSVVLGNVGRENWRRALELYECLNLRKWYTPHRRMLATILGVLGRWNQVHIARELFVRAEPELTGEHIQVFNGILGVYAKQGSWQAVEQILELMESKGCEPDLITFNSVINARCKGDLQPGMAMTLLKEVRRASLKPDLITFNTLLGGCIANKNFMEAKEIAKEMVKRGYEPDAYSKYLLGKKKGLLQEIG